MSGIFWKRKGAAEPMPTPMPTPMPMPTPTPTSRFCEDFEGGFEQVLMLNWKNILPRMRQTRKDNMEPVETNVSYAQGMNWVEAKVTVLSATCFILLLMLVIPWLRSYIRLIKEAKRKISDGPKIDHTNTVVS